jgi:triosephosphate isomerase (TIM)
LKRYAIANWKMNVPPEGIGAYLDAVANHDGIVVAPPYPFVKEVAGRVAAAGQNCAEQKSGAFTGEIAADMLRDCGASFVIVGHSERRNLFNESDEIVARKVQRVIEAGLTPILCVGEDQRVRDRGGAGRFVSNQIRSAATALQGARQIVVAYEPVWAIGTGRNATGAMVAEMVREIRAALDQFWPKPISAMTPILYGGSCTPANINDIGPESHVAGYLIGGASLDSAKLLAIHESLGRLSPA